jgi:membrane fusion protein, multidrug efflux system
MGLRTRIEARGEQSLLEFQESQSPRIAPEATVDYDHQRADAGNQSAYARTKSPQQLPGERRIEEFPREHEDQQRDIERADPPRRGFLRRHPFASVSMLLLLGLAAAGGALYWNYSDHFETTDDAFVAARQYPISPKVSGYLTDVPVTDNQHVAAGDVIARIDDRDYRTALEQAQAQVTNAEAAIQNIDAQTNVQQAQIGANQAQVNQAQAALVFAQQQAVRYQELAQRGAGSIQNAEQYDSQQRQQQAAVESAQATLKLAQRQLESLKAQRESAVANLAQAKAQRDQARLNLSYTTVTAAQPGRVVNLGAAVGQYVQPGTNLTMFVPDEIWVTANFKENQLDAMRPGQAVTLHIDAYPERTIRGHVASIQPGSGTAFSLLPAENATGNYVKIVQRVPVKIIVDNPPTDVALGPGMSVVPSVRVDPNPSLYEQLRASL